MTITRIATIQGSGLLSPLADTVVTTHGVVTGHSRKGFYIQDPHGSDDPAVSSGIFIFSPREKPNLDGWVAVHGEVVDYVPAENERPTTQIKAHETQRLERRSVKIAPVWFTADKLPEDRNELARYLNSLEGMLVGIEAGATFVAPSNPFGDYVVLPRGTHATRTHHGGVLIDRNNPERWLPSFRIIDYDRAPQVNVGATLLSPVVGPLNYRASSFQVAARESVKVHNVDIPNLKTRLQPDKAHATVLTLNGFNLDVQREDPERVNDPRRDVDDDLYDGRFTKLAFAIVEQAGSPDVVALQEIQDDDGAEITEVVAAGRNYAQLVRDVRKLGGPAYRWADIAPEVGADGGQPGGNIRNAYLYNPQRVTLVKGSLRRLGDDDEVFDGSRKPLLGRFRWSDSGKEFAIVNVHLASKRHQHGTFAPERPGHDPRLDIRVRQAEIVRETLRDLAKKGIDYYATGDFNDFEFSDTLRALLGDESANLVEMVSGDERYDYNHRGISQVLMHGIVSLTTHEQGRAEYEILHGNELIGAKPGDLGGKATDHAYVIARLGLAK